MEHPGGVSETTGTLVLMTLAGDTEDTEDTEKSSNTLNVDRMEDPDANQRQAEITSKCTAVSSDRASSFPLPLLVSI